MDINEMRYGSSIEQITGQYLNHNTAQKVNNDSEVSFEDILREKKLDGEELKFSKHASQRLADRNIDLSESQLERLERGAKISGEKGIKDSLVLMDDYAFIVNTQKNTVITAMEQGREGENIFTNIDGAVLV